MQLVGLVKDGHHHHHHHRILFPPMKLKNCSISVKKQSFIPSFYVLMPIRYLYGRLNFSIFFLSTLTITMYETSNKNSKPLMPNIPKGQHLSHLLIAKSLSASVEWQILIWMFLCWNDCIVLWWTIQNIRLLLTVNDVLLINCSVADRFTIIFRLH
jgi:hypothetical protein